MSVEGTQLPLQGDWRVAGESLALDYRGTLEFALNFAEEGYYRLDVSLREASPYRDWSQFELQGQLGSIHLGSRSAGASSQESVTLSFWLPWRPAGTESLILDWVNIDTGASLQVDRIELVQQLFASEDAQNRWIADQIAGEFALDTAPDSGAEPESGAGVLSHTSPWSLTGRALDLDSVQITVDSSALAISRSAPCAQTFMPIFHCNHPSSPPKSP